MDAKLIRLPQRFLMDHEDRALPTPEVVKQTKAHFFVRADDPNLSELLNDAEFYSHRWGPDGEGLEGIKASARATVKAIKEAQ